MASASVFSVEGDKMTEGWIEIESSPVAFARARDFNHVKCYYSFCFTPCSVKVCENHKLIHEDSLITDGYGHSVDLDFPKTPG